MKNNIFRDDEFSFALNKHFAQYGKMIRENKIDDLYYYWQAWCDDIMCGQFGGKRNYENCDQMVYDWCMEHNYLVMTN